MKAHRSLLQKKHIFWIRQPEQVKQQVTPPIKNLIRTYHNGVKQSVVKSNILECVRVGEKVMLIILTKKWKEKVVNSKILKYLSVAEKVMLKL